MPFWCKNHNYNNHHKTVFTSNLVRMWIFTKWTLIARPILCITNLIEKMFTYKLGMSLGRFFPARAELGPGPVRPGPWWAKPQKWPSIRPGPGRARLGRSLNSSLWVEFGPFFSGPGLTWAKKNRPGPRWAKWPSIRPGPRPKLIPSQNSLFQM